jgi:hypothetical protein
MPYPSFRANTAVMAALAAAGVALFANPAAAGPCYVVLDRSDAVIYQSPQPPVDLSTAGAAAREAMRKRGEDLLNFDAENCPVRIPVSRSGKAEASVDEIVATFKPYNTVGMSNASGQGASINNAPLTNGR